MTLYSRNNENLSDDINLNNYIIMPFYDIEYSPQNQDEELYQQIWYSIKNEGFIKSDGEEDLKELEKGINSLNKEYDLFFEVIDNPIILNLQ